MSGDAGSTAIKTKVPWPILPDYYAGLPQPPREFTAVPAKIYLHKPNRLTKGLRRSSQCRHATVIKAPAGGIISQGAA